MTEREPVGTFECDAILFDLDGVLVDSQAVVVRTWQEWAVEKDLDAGRILEVAHGRRPAEVLRDFAPELDADAEARELERMETNDLEGVLEIEGAGPSPPAGWSTSACRGPRGS